MNLFQKIFKSKKPPQTTERVELLSGSTSLFSAWSGDAYSSDIYRAAVDSIARNIAKLKASHVVKNTGSTKVEADARLTQILQVEPNRFMNSYDLWYKLATHLFLFNNSFALLDKDDTGNLRNIFPLDVAAAEFLAAPTGELYVKFRFRSGKEATFPYSDVIHLRRHFNSNDLLGTPNDAINSVIELAHVQTQGIEQGIKNSANIRGILKFTQLLSPEKLRKERDAFMEDYLSINNDGGVVATDQKMEYVPIDLKPALIDKRQMDAVKTKIYEYLGVSDKIVNSSYDEDVWAAFYESTIEPIALQLSLEFTRKIFTPKEQEFGNSILFESGRLQFSSNRTKIRLISVLVPYGLLSINQALEILNLPTVEDGDRRLQTLNVVDAAAANSYQLSDIQRQLKEEATKELAEDDE